MTRKAFTAVKTEPLFDAANMDLSAAAAAHPYWEPKSGCGTIQRSHRTIRTQTGDNLGLGTTSAFVAEKSCGGLVFVCVKHGSKKVRLY